MMILGMRMRSESICINLLLNMIRRAPIPLARSGWNAGAPMRICVILMNGRLGV